MRADHARDDQRPEPHHPVGGAQDAREPPRLEARDVDQQSLHRGATAASATRAPRSAYGPALLRGFDASICTTLQWRADIAPSQ